MSRIKYGIIGSGVCEKPLRMCAAIITRESRPLIGYRLEPVWIDPGVNFNSPFVSFLHYKCQWIVTGVHTSGAHQVR